MPVSHVLDVNTENLTEIVERSMSLPVLFYFWSARSQHCLKLTPILDKLAVTYSGQFILAKIDCDGQQRVAAQFGLQAIPAVYLFKDGQPIDGFQGPQLAVPEIQPHPDRPQPETAIRELLQQVLPEPEELKAAEGAALIEEGKVQEALSLLTAAYELDKKNNEIALQLAKAQILLKRSDEAKKTLANIPPAEQDSRYQGLKAEITLLEQAAHTPEIQQLEQRVAQDPDNTELAIQLSLQFHQTGRNQDALELLLKHLKTDRSDTNHETRKIFMDILAALGPNDSLASSYRRQFYSLLY